MWYGGDTLNLPAHPVGSLQSESVLHQATMFDEPKQRAVGQILKKWSG